MVYGLSVCCVLCMRCVWWAVASAHCTPPLSTHLVYCLFGKYFALLCLLAGFD